MAELPPAALLTLRALVEERAGLTIPDERVPELVRLLAARARALRAEGLADYVARLAVRADGGRELDRVIQALAVHETYFFRDRAQLERLVDRVLPERASARGAVHVLSAGASTGAEAHSLLILVRERRPELAPAVQVVGVDLAPSVIAAARLGRYPPWALRDAPPELVSRYFQPRGHVQELGAEIRARASFEVRNLNEDDDGFWEAARFDVILCRNVLMYLAPAPAEALVARFERSLAEGGCLFLGHAETLRGFSTALVAEHEDGVTFYRRPVARASPARPPALAPRAPEAPPAPALREPREAWIRRALALVEGGDLGDAEAACARAQEAAGALDPVPHFLQALCRERAGDAAGAVRHHTAAACIDPTFAMPCIHLGLLARRSGDHRAARRELSRAVTLLAGEDEARLRLLGGGLPREALLRICSTVLQRGEAAR